MSRTSRISTLLLSVSMVTGACQKSVTAPEQEDFTTPGSITMEAGDGQVVPRGLQPNPLRVVVFTPGGKKCNGCTVTWSLSPGQFLGGPVITQTSVFGEVTLTLNGFGTGVYMVTARLVNGASVDFHFTVQ